MTAQIKVKVQRKAVVRLKVIPRFPSNVNGTSGVLIDKTGGAFTFSIDPNSAVITNPNPSRDKSIARYNGLAGNRMQDSGVLIDDANSITGVINLSASGVLTGANLPLPVEFFGASIGASAAVNDAAFAFTISIATGQGNRSVSVNVGTYNLSADLTLGSIEFIGASKTGTILNFSGSKGIIIPVGSSATIRDMKIITAGTAVRAGGSSGYSYHNRIENVWFFNNLIGIDANSLVFSRFINCEFEGYTQEGIHITSVFNTDAGDNLIEGPIFVTNGGVSGGSSNAAVFHESGGGWKMVGEKIVGGNRGWWHAANYSGVCSSLIIEGGSIEGVAQGEIVISNQSSTVGSLFNVLIDGVQGGADTYGVYVLPRGSSAWITDLVINGLAVRNSNGATAAYSIDGVDGLDISGGSLNNAGTGVTGIVIGAHCTGQVILPAISGYTTRYTNASSGVKVIDFGGSLTTTAAVSVLGGFSVIWRATAATDITMPLTGTLATLAGAETFTNKTLTAPTINGGTHTAITALGIRSSGSGAFDIRLTNTENLTAQRSLILQLGDADRLLAFGGNIATTAAFSLLGGFAMTQRTTAATDVTFPTSGTLAVTGSSLAQFAATTSAQLAALLTDETGSGANVFATSPTLVTPALGTPSSINLANATFPAITAFSAHKNGTDQTGVVNATFTKVTFTTEIFDQGSAYDAPNSKWTPPVGIVQISAGVLCTTNVTDAAIFQFAIYKNGAVFKETLDLAAGAGNKGLSLSLVDQANGTDFYELYIWQNTGSNVTVSGLAVVTFFSGVVIR